MPKKSPPKSLRLNLEISPAVRSQLETVKERVDSVSFTDIIRRSLAFFDLATEHRCDGGSIIFRHADGREEALKTI